MLKLYNHRKVNTFYEGETGGNANAEAKAAEEAAIKAEADKKAAEEAAKKNRTYTQEELDKIVEAERTRVKEQTRSQISQLEELKKNLNNTAESEAALQKRIDELNKTLLTKEELTKREKEALEKKSKEEIENLAKDRDTWQSRFKTSMITRSLTDAAHKEEAFNPDVLVGILSSKAKVVETLKPDGKPTGDFTVKVSLSGKDKEGKPQELDLDPMDAVKFLKEDPQYHFMFKATAGSGVGGRGNETVKDIDVKNLTPEQYKKHRQQLRNQ